MKTILTIAFCMSVVIGWTQPTLQLPDGSFLQIEGELIAEQVVYGYTDSSTPEKNVTSYCNGEEGLIIISVYSAWMNGEMDELHVYTFFDNDISGKLTVTEETDDIGRFLVYSLTFESYPGKPFTHMSYTKSGAQETPDPFSIFTLYSDSKEGLEKLAGQFNK